MNNTKCNCIRCNKIKISWRRRWLGDSLEGFVGHTTYIKNGMFNINLDVGICEDCAMEIYDKIKDFMASNL